MRPDDPEKLQPLTVLSVQEMLISCYGFQQSDITVLIDTDKKYVADL